MSGLFDELAGPSAPKPKSSPQISFEDVVKEIHTQNVQIQILEQ